MRLDANCGATVTLRSGHADTSAKVPSASERYAKTCAVAPSACSVWLTIAETEAELVEDANNDGNTVTVASVMAYARMPVTATGVAETTRVLDAPAAETTTEPARTPVTS